MAKTPDNIRTNQKSAGLGEILIFEKLKYKSIPKTRGTIAII